MAVPGQAAIGWPALANHGGLPMSDRLALANAIENAGIPSDKRLRREQPWS